MKIKRFLSLLLAAVMVLTLAGCSSIYTGKLGSDLKYYNFPSPYYTDSDEDVIKKLPEPSLTLDVQDIYASIEYNARMFYGQYRLYDFEKDMESYAKSAQYMNLDVVDYYGNVDNHKLSTLPVQIRLGPTEVDMARYDRSHEWAQLYFAHENGTYYYNVICTYRVSGDEIIFTPLQQLTVHRDENYYVTGYEYTIGSKDLAFKFAFDGPRITLSNDSGSVTLHGYGFGKDQNPQVSGYLASDSKMFGKIDHFHGYISTDPFDSFATGYVAYKEGVYAYDYALENCIRLYDNGLLDFYWVDRDENRKDTVHFQQFVYFGTNPMVLTDGENFYYYTESYTSREMALMGDGMSTEDLIEFENMGEDAQKEIVEKKANLLNDLSEAFQEAGLNVRINHSTGEIALDSAVLFGVNQSDISEDGKTFLQKFLAVYTGVVFGDEYSDFVSKIMVEGHTDTSGSYELNLELSQARADSVLAFCLSDEAMVDQAYVENLRQTLEAVGYSYDKPVYQENGEVDMDASRRVSFRFIIKIGD